MSRCGRGLGGVMMGVSPLLTPWRRGRRWLPECEAVSMGSKSMQADDQPGPVTASRW